MLQPYIIKGLKKISKFYEITSRNTQTQIHININGGSPDGNSEAISFNYTFYLITTT